MAALFHRLWRSRRARVSTLFEPLEGRQLASAATTVTMDSVTLTSPLSGPITNNSQFQLTAHEVVGKSKTVVAAVFFLDVNHNGVVDGHDRPLAEPAKTAGTNEFVATINAKSLPLGENTILVRAVDKDGGFSNGQVGADHTIVVTVVAGPSIDSLSLSTTSMPTATTKLTLSAKGVRGSDTKAPNAVTGVEFFLDSNANGLIDDGDTDLGAGVKSGSTWSLRKITLPAGTDLTHSIQFLAQATDAAARTSAVVSAVSGPKMSFTSVLPTLTLTPAVTRLTLSAAGLVSPGPGVSEVRFWEDTNNDGILDNGDTDLGIGKRPASATYFSLVLDPSVLLPTASPTIRIFSKITNKKGVESLVYATTITDARVV